MEAEPWGRPTRVRYGARGFWVGTVVLLGGGAALAPSAPIVAPFFIAFGGLTLAAVIQCKRIGERALVIDGEGIAHTGIWGTRYEVPWSEITGAREGEYGVVVELRAARNQFRVPPRVARRKRDRCSLFLRSSLAISGKKLVELIRAHLAHAAGETAAPGRGSGRSSQELKRAAEDERVEKRRETGVSGRRTFPRTRRHFAWLLGACLGLVLALAIVGSTAHDHHIEWLASAMFFAILIICVVGLVFVVGVISPRTPRRLLSRLFQADADALAGGEHELTPTQAPGSPEELELSSRLSWAAHFAVALVLVAALVYGGVALQNAGLGWVAGGILLLCLTPALTLAGYTVVALVGIVSPRVVHDWVNRHE